VGSGTRFISSRRRAVAFYFGRSGVKETSNHSSWSFAIILRCSAHASHFATASGGNLWEVSLDQAGRNLEQKAHPTEQNQVECMSKSH